MKLANVKAQMIDTIFISLGLIIGIFSTVLATAETSSDVPYNLSYSSGAFAANAGGQDAHAVRLNRGRSEWHLFANRSLVVGTYPLFGGGYDLKFDMCDECFWKIFIQTGGGLSNAGPYAELLWGLTVPIIPIWLPMRPPRYLPHLRLDFASHLLFSQIRPSTWVYPIWLGVGVPL